ncbi:MAG TPA: hypothetical protein VHX38_18770 [Pseudonocardiaceae bacterium]|jgi:hypothetical protein|nr:hypothetical protein [Pseudonocardiaceae bacterium]
MANVTFTGPFFDSSGSGLLADGITAARHAVADKGVELVREAFDEHIRVNNGRHTSTITTADESRTYTSDGGRHSYSMDIDVPDDTTAVTTSNATYGPWLSGTGSRNPVTRFKGYPAFGEAAEQLDEQATGIAEEALAPYIDKLNG